MPFAGATRTASASTTGTRSSSRTRSGSRSEEHTSELQSQCHAARRHLHSAPTRRPSALEEAGEAARRQGAKPLVAMVGSSDPGKLIFAARAITAYVDALRWGHSHRERFDDGDAKQFADAKRI